MTQINLNSPIILFAVKAIKYLFVAIIFHFALQWFGGCSSENKKTTQKVIVPAVSGKFEAKKPESSPLEIKQNPVSEIKKDGLVYVENPLNEKLIKENDSLKINYAIISDSLKTKAYDKAIELNKFSSIFEDKYMKLTINGIVRGEVQEVTPEYILKQREVEAAVKETKLRVLLGGSVGINKDLNQQNLRNR